VGQALRIDGDVALDAGDLLPRVVALLLGAIGVLDALRVDDQKARRGAAPLFYAGRANYIFLKPVPERLRHLDQAHSTWRSTRAPCATSDIRSAACAIGSHF